MYVAVVGRFSVPDPLYIDLDRLVDPQQLNLYVYARSNPLLIIDPTGLDIEVLGTEQNNYLKRLQSILSFTVQLNKQSNKIEIVDSKGNTLDAKAQKDLGKTLKGGERQLFEAITDPKHHVKIDTVRKDTNVFFGSFDGNGKNTIDFGDVDTLDSAKNSGGITASQVVGHETLEAYAGSKGDVYIDAHAAANRFYGGLKDIAGTGAAFAANPNTPTLATHLSQEFSVIGSKGVKAKVFFELTTPVPIASIPQLIKSGVKIPAHVAAVEKKP